MRILPRTRAAVAAVTGVLLLAELILDPYTWWKDATDLIQPAPWWQRAIGVSNGVLLTAVIALVIGRRWMAARQVLLVETLFRLAIAIIFVRRDGIGRFVGGFGAEEFLSVFLFAMLARILLLEIVLPERPAKSGR